MHQGNRGRGGGRSSIAQSVTQRVIEGVMQDKIRNMQEDVNLEVQVSKLEKPLNPKDASGQYLTCHNCGS